MFVLSLSLAFADKLQVRIHGLEDNKIALTNVQNALSIYEFQNREAPAPLRVEWLNKQAPQEIQDALEPYGYYKPKIQTELKKENDEWIADYTIALGEPVLIDDLIFEITGEGNRKRIFKNIIIDSDLRLQKPLNQVSYEKVKNSLQTQALAMGYFEVDFPAHEVVVNLDKYTGSIDLSMDTGRRYHFGEVTFESDYFSQELLRRYLQINEETEFSDKRTIALQQDLDASNYFEEVLITPTIDHENRTVPLNIKVKRNKQRVFSAGIGYSSDIGMRLSGAGTWRYLNKMGHKMNIDLLLAQKQRRAIINYRLPGRNPVTSHHDFYLKYNYEDTKYRDYSAFIIGASSTYKSGKLERFYSLDYRNDRFRTPLGEHKKASMILPAATFTWQNLTAPEFSSWFIKGSVMIRGSAKAVASDVNFIQVKVGGILHIPFFAKDRLILHGEMGHTLVPNEDIYKLSPELLFQTGGDNSVRGYRFNGIGERGYRRDEIYGGKKLVVASVEWEHKITKDWAVATFVDAGDAFNSSRPNWKFGAGVGARWYSPIGAVKIDVAHGFNREFGDTFRLHLNVGIDI